MNLFCITITKKKIPFDAHGFNKILDIITHFSASQVLIILLDQHFNYVYIKSTIKEI